MFGKSHLGWVTALVTLFLLGEMCPVFGAGFKQLHGHVPEATKNLTAIGRLPATNELHLAIGVPLRDPAGLDQFLADVYDPASPNYRHFLEPAEFTARFSATESDYAAVKNFALTNGFKITQEHGNRLLLDVTAKAADVERAFHLKLNRFKHPTENLNFFAPDAEPTVDAALAIVDIQGLSDFVRPHPKLRKMEPKTVAPRNGSAPDSSGAYFGNDFRNAYAPGVALTGAGQQVGLFQLDDYYNSDIATYAATAGGGRTNIVIQRVVFPGDTVTPDVNGGNIEVSIDIEMAMAMAPSLTKIVVFESSYSINGVLSMMAASNTVKNLSSSWGWGGGPSVTTDNIFQQMASQGQSYFNASGDSDAFLSGAVDNPSYTNAPSSSPYITQVGGTTLTTGSSATYASETVWNQSNGAGSSGGVSSHYSIPVWQQGISMTANQGSTTYRNIPDVALTAENNFFYFENGNSGNYGGTSCAAPLWAGFMALVNQQFIQNSGIATNSVGFINPAIYAIGSGQNPNFTYGSCFHDTTSGNNYWSSSPANYPAVTGYDLCTGWGTPNGQNLINALAAVSDTLGITPPSGTNMAGVSGGPFSPSSQNFILTNSGASSLNWSVNNTSTWLTVSATSGVLAAAGHTNVTINLNSAANGLAEGAYAATITFSNHTTGILQNRQITLQILDPLLLLTTNGFITFGAAGGSFTPSSQAAMFTNLSAGAVSWSLINTSLWLSVSSGSGSLSGNSSVSVTVATNAATANLTTGIYSATLVLSNRVSHFTQSLVFAAYISTPLLQNGGFETGDFTAWTLNGDGYNYNYVTNSSYGIPPHSGTNLALLGELGFQAYLSQTVPTVSGQQYLISLWLYNPLKGDVNNPNEFSVSWNGNSLYDKVNLPKITTWTNLLFVVSATGYNTVLQIGGRNDNSYLGLDDVSVLPIPAPTVTGFRKTTNGFALTWNTLAGITNIVQYKTNLLQTNWINLVTNIATTNTFSYTNLIGADPRRFYRVERLP